MQPQEKDCDHLSISVDIDAIIGVYPYERISPQTLRVILTIFSETFLTRTELSAHFEGILKEYTQKEKPQLLERMAHSLSLKLLTLDLKLDDFLVTVEKPQAVEQARCSYASIRFRRVEQGFWD